MKWKRKPSCLIVSGWTVHQAIVLLSSFISVGTEKLMSPLPTGCLPGGVADEAARILV